VFDEEPVNSTTSAKSVMQALPAALLVSARVGAIVPLDSKKSNSWKRSTI
jgi:hypothetical protein